MNIKNKEAEDIVKTTKGPSRRRKGTADPMPSVRRVDTPDEDDAAGLRVSRVQPVDRSGSLEELRDGSERLGSQPDSLTGIERTISKINAYRSLLNKKIVLKGVPSDLHDEIIKEFKSWVENQVLSLLGMGPDVKSNPEDSFSSGEIQTLRMLAAQVQSKMGAPTPPVRAQNFAKPNPNAQPLNPSYPSNPNNLKPSMDMDKYNHEQMKILEDMRKLADMDRDGPVF